MSKAQPKIKQSKNAKKAAKKTKTDTIIAFVLDKSGSMSMRQSTT